MPENNFTQFWADASERPAISHDEVAQLVRSVFSVGSEIRPVPSAPGCYVSACGRVFSSLPCIRDANQQVRERKPITTKHGYISVTLQINKRRTLRYVHRLVAEVFLPPPEGNQNVVRHLNGDPGDNRISNLAWGTQADNMQDAVRHGRTLRGRKNPNAKLNPARIKAIKILLEEGFSPTAIAAFMGASRDTIRRAANGESWGD